MGRREDNKQRKRSRLLTEGLKRILEVGYDLASVEQIASAADVARGTFYLYYRDKQALFEVLVDRWVQPTLALLAEVDEALAEATTRDESLAIYQRMAMDLTTIGLAHPDVILMSSRELRRPGPAGELLRLREKAILEAAARLTRRAADRGLITVADPDLAALIITGAVERLVYASLVDDLPDPQYAAIEAVRMFARALELPA